MDAAKLDDVVALALTLTPKERLQLVERVTASVEETLVGTDQPDPQWGHKLNLLLDQVDLSYWQSPEFEDAEAWVEKLREAQDSRYVWM